MNNRGHKSIHPIVRPDHSRLPEGMGMSLREHYAGLAMQGLITWLGDAENYDEVGLAQRAVKHADALLEALGQ